MTQSELQEVYNARTVMEATFIAQQLEAAGIRAQVVNSTLQNAVGELPYMAVSPRIWVRAEDQERALLLIQQHFQDDGDAVSSNEDWTCPRCSEINGPAFAFCWKCTYAQPSDHRETSTGPVSDDR